MAGDKTLCSGKSGKRGGDRHGEGNLFLESFGEKKKWPHGRKNNRPSVLKEEDRVPNHGESSLVGRDWLAKKDEERWGRKGSKFGRGPQTKDRGEKVP